MMKIEDRTFNAALREALREAYEDDIREFMNPRKTIKKKRILAAAAVAAVLAAVILPVWGFYLSYNEIYHKDYTKIAFSDSEEHSASVDSLDIGYIPDGWERETLSVSDGLIVEKAGNDKSYLIISKRAFYEGLSISIDNSYGKPEIKYKNGISYYIYTQEEMAIVTFLNDYQYVIDAFNVDMTELLEIAYNI
ncbi:MAG: DUF4367 domain-containing protein, partial [Clostridia bacterium]|nr:DUF4367 domain-containing protein [Clostridia bacterium]